MNIYEKIQAARVELQNKKLKKSGKNNFAGFEYFELSDFLPAINEIFHKQKLFSRFLINEKQATLQIINAEDIKEEIIFSMPTAELELKGCNKIQALGGINTYLRRYLYLNALEIVEADLFDAETGKDNKQSVNNDTDIIAGLAGVSDLKNLEKYYKANKDKVSDINAFNLATNRRKTAIQEEHANDNI